MELRTLGTTPISPRYGHCAAAVLGALACLLALGSTALALTGTAPDLGVASSFAVLGGSAVTNTGSSIINGDLGVSPGSAITGFPPGVVNGTTHASDAVAAQAQSDLTAAYNNAAGQKPCTDETGKVLGQDIGTSGTPLPPGVYCWSTSAQLTGALNLSGAGVYLFQVGSTLTTAPGSSVVLAGSASSCQVFWQVGSSATLDTTTHFAGTLMALASISINNGAVIDGRVLARTGQVSLISDTITRPDCGGASTATVVGSSSNPAAAGTPVTFTATVTGASSGTVSFYDGSTKLGSGTVNSGGQATLTVSNLTPGQHQITAVYSGGPGVHPSTSPPLTQTITAPPTTPTPTPTATPQLPSAGMQPGDVPAPLGLPAALLALLAILGVAAAVLRGRRT